MTSLLQRSLPADTSAHEALAAIQPGAIGLLLRGDDTTAWGVFRPGERVCPHTRHVRKYVDTVLPDDRAFYFHQTGNTQPSVARSIGEFAAAVAAVPMASLAHHFDGGDFSRWASDVIGDAVLAAGFRKLERVVRDGGRPSRAEILAQVAARYHVGDAPHTSPAPAPVPALPVAPSPASASA